MAETQRYERSAVVRYAPSDWQKKALRCDWSDTDRVAIGAVDGQPGGVNEPYTDRHGYPT